MRELTVPEVQKALPNHMNVRVSQEMVDQLNNLSKDPIHAEAMRENFISYTGVLKDSRFRLDEYVHAVAYVSYKLMGYSNIESYTRVFPGRYAALQARGATDKDVSSYVASYNKGKLVNLILEQTLIPTHVLNASVYQEAINNQAWLMVHAKSEKVRSDAANSILTHLKPPEKKKIELDIGSGENKTMGDLKDALVALAKQQQDLMKAGMRTQEVAHQRLVSPEVVDITPEEVDE